MTPTVRLLSLLFIPKPAKQVRCTLALFFCFVIGLFVVAGRAYGLPAVCSAPGNFCVAPEISPWQYWGYPGFGRPILGPFDTEAEAVSAVAARMTQPDTGWCTVTPRAPVVTYDDNFSWGGTPWRDGNIDGQHGNTIHYDVTGYSYETVPCGQAWQYDPGLLQHRQIKCAQPLTKIYDTSVTPNVPLCLGSHTAAQPRKASGTCSATSSKIWKGNPCDTNGNKYQAESDYVGAGNSQLVFVRSYNSVAANEHSDSPSNANPVMVVPRTRLEPMMQTETPCPSSISTTT